MLWLLSARTNIFSNLHRKRAENEKEERTEAIKHVFISLRSVAPLLLNPRGQAVF